MDVNKKISNIIKLAQNQGHYSSRTVGTTIYQPEILVMHYTEESLEQTIEIFTGAENSVSAHYVICEKGNIFQNIEEEHAAHHAGLSYWRGITGTPDGSSTGAMNLCSLGIEHVNMGYRADKSQPRGIVHGDREWYDFGERQIHASIKLAQQLVKKYNIKPEDVVGHSDIAPKRKVDPGPLFPWDKFAAEGVGAWPDPILGDFSKLACFSNLVDQLEKASDDEESSLSKQLLEQWVIQHLHDWGYKKPDDRNMDKKPEERASAEDIILSFQMHFQPLDDEGNATTGIANYNTAVILKSLICKYKGGQCSCPKFE